MKFDVHLEINEAQEIPITSAHQISEHIDLSVICTLQKAPGNFVQWFIEDGESSISRRYGSGDTHFIAEVDAFDRDDLIAIFQCFFAGDTSWHDIYGLVWERGPEIGDDDVEYIDLGEFEPE